VDTDLLRTKIGYGFDNLDVDGDGALTEADYVLMGQRTAAELGYPPGSIAEQRAIEGYLTVWREVHRPRAVDGGINRERFIAGTLRLATDPGLAQASVGALGEIVFEIADRDGNGVIDPDEYAAFLRALFPGVTRDDADEAFRHLDADHDGVLRRQEFVTAIIQFWSSGDPEAPGNWWAGPPNNYRGAVAW
jgi:hypothetical protein